jgi:AcrR family transcriptional regulator
LAQGFRSVTMDDLASELGMSKKTLYAHFPSKKAMLETIVADKFRRVDSDLTSITRKPNGGFTGTLQRMLACVHRHIDEIKPPFLRDIQREYPELFQMVDRHRQEVIQRHLGAVLVKGQREGAVRKDLPVHLIIEILLAALRAIVNPSRLQELDLTPRRGVNTILSVVLEGVLKRQERAMP